MPYAVEYTDTFGGEANYSWVRRATIPTPPKERDTVYTSARTVAQKERTWRRALVRDAKAAVGLTGVKGRTFWHSRDDIEFRPYRMATVMFATWCEQMDSEED